MVAGGCCTWAKRGRAHVKDRGQVLPGRKGVGREDSKGGVEGKVPGYAGSILLDGKGIRAARVPIRVNHLVQW